MTETSSRTAQCFGDQRQAVAAAYIQRRRVKLDKFEIARSRASSQAQGHAASVGTRGIARTREECADATGGKHDRRGLDLLAATTGITRTHGADAAITQQQRLHIHAAAPLDVGGAFGLLAHGADYLRTAGIAAGVHHPRSTMTTLSAQQQAAVRITVKSHPDLRKPLDGSGRVHA